MLELRPVCEHCTRPLPANSTEAMICSFECTFCRDCVALLNNVCPHCGGGFVSRPIRPKLNHRDNNNLAHYPASSICKHQAVDLQAHAQFAARIKVIPPQDR